MSRLRLAAGGAIMKLAQEPCYHEIITPEQFQLCGLVINASLAFISDFSASVIDEKVKKKNFISTDAVCSSVQDECYQVRQIFAQKLHLALVKLLLPLEYLAVFALCAKDPVKERRAHARQCLLKNISVRREYIKQNPLAQGQFSTPKHQFLMCSFLDGSLDDERGSFNPNVVQIVTNVMLILGF